MAENIYEKIKREAREKAEKQQSGKSLEERLNLVPTSPKAGGKSLEDRLNIRR